MSKGGLQGWQRDELWVLECPRGVRRGGNGRSCRWQETKGIIITAVHSIVTNADYHYDYDYYCYYYYILLLLLLLLIIIVITIIYYYCYYYSLLLFLLLLFIIIVIIFIDFYCYSFKNHSYYYHEFQPSF